MRSSKLISCLKPILHRFLLAGILFLAYGCSRSVKQPVDYIDPYIGNISHLLVPTFPMVHLPNSMLRICPARNDFTGDVLHGLPLIITSHRGSSAFNLSPYQGKEEGIKSVIKYSYDHEEIKPYFYSVWLDEQQTEVRFSPSRQSALYRLDFTQDKPSYLIINSPDGELKVYGNAVSGFQRINHNTNVYIYFETEQIPESSSQEDSFIILYYGSHAQTINARYGISFISEEQAKHNLEREINHYDIDLQAGKGRDIWNEALGRIEIDDRNESNKTVFYTSLYRVFERPVNISEGGRYFSAFDGKVHEDEGRPFYTDDWIWDTYRATHPLRILIDPEVEVDIIRSFITMARQMPQLWMPTFPEITGDSRRMNSNHAVATVLDAYVKGLCNFDVETAYLASKKGIEEKTLAPWSAEPAGWLNEFYDQNGYIPALRDDEEETEPDVHGWEKRQPVAVTLGTAYDQWCLSQLAKELGKDEEQKIYLVKSYNYRNIFNHDTQFFHPKDKEGNFIEPFDYSFPGGMGAREYYGENNGWIFKWDVQHNVADLIQLMGGNGNFCKNLDEMFRAPLGRSKFEFYAKLPDHTGNVGQFSMANEPALHIPYLYNYAGRPWKTQKRIRMLLKQWFRNDLMGMPGDEDGGGMSAFVVFSAMGFYPVTPGIPAYNIGSPLFSNVKISLGNGKVFEIQAKNCSEENKYIQSAKLNGIPLEQAYFWHDDIKNGGKLILEMGSKPNYSWGNGPLPEQLSADKLNE